MEVALGLIDEERIDTVGKLWAIHKEFISEAQTWIFRGHKTNYPLKTSLERVMDRYGKNKADSLLFEGGFLRRFKRQAGNYLKHIPRDDDFMEWFALMQHHGAPTRLLDWTYSFFVAVYFAVVDSPNDENSIVWALNTKELNELILEKVPSQNTAIIGQDPNARTAESFTRFFINNAYTVVCPMNPYNFNERLIIQQGVFLCPGNVTKSFEENFVGLFSTTEMLRRNIRKFVIPNNIKTMIEKNLCRMNMTNATLFPGLDGFAQSLKMWLSFDDANCILVPDACYPH